MSLSDGQRVVVRDFGPATVIGRYAHDPYGETWLVRLDTPRGSTEVLAVTTRDLI